MNSILDIRITLRMSNANLIILGRRFQEIHTSLMNGLLDFEQPSGMFQVEIFNQENVKVFSCSTVIILDMLMLDTEDWKNLVLYDYYKIITTPIVFSSLELNKPLENDLSKIKHYITTS